MTQDTLPAMTGAEMQVTREFLGLDRKWLSEVMVINDRRMARMEAGQEPIPDALVAKVDDIAEETKELVSEMIAEYRRRVKRNDGTVSIKTFRRDEDYSGENMSFAAQQKIADLKTQVRDLEDELREVGLLDTAEEFFRKRAEHKKMAADYKRKQDYNIPAPTLQRQTSVVQAKAEGLERHLRDGQVLSEAEELFNKRSELARTQYPCRWHRMLCARVADAVPGLILVNR